MKTPKKTVVVHRVRVISQPGAAIQVFALKLSPEEQRQLVFLFDDRQSPTLGTHKPGRRHAVTTRG